MPAVAYAHFPKEFHRNIIKELDQRFWTIFLICFVIINSFALYMKDKVFVPSIEDQQKYMATLYRVKPEPIVAIEKPKSEEEKRKEEEKKEEEVKEKVEKVRKERASQSDEQKAAKRSELKKARSERAASSRQKAASMFAAAGASRGGKAVGRGGSKARGSGKEFRGIVGSSRGITSGGRGTMGGVSKVISGSSVDEAAGAIEITDVEAGELEAGDLGGGLEMEEISEVAGAGAKNEKRSAESLNAVIQTKQGSIQRCFEKERKKDPQLNGRVTIKFTILADGTVDRVTIRGRWSNPRFGKAVEECVRKRVESWRFDPIDQGNVTIEFPLSFY